MPYTGNQVILQIFRYESFGSEDCCSCHFDHCWPLMPEKDLGPGQEPASPRFQANWRDTQGTRKEWQIEKAGKRFKTWETCSPVLKTDFYAERGETCDCGQNGNGDDCQACSQMEDTTRVDQKPRKWSVNPQHKLVSACSPLQCNLVDWMCFEATVWIVLEMMFGLPELINNDWHLQWTQNIINIKSTICLWLQFEAKILDHYWHKFFRVQSIFIFKQNVSSHT